MPATSRVRLDRNDFDPGLLDLGLLTGLLTDRDEGGAPLDGHVDLTLDWFSRPLDELARIPSERTGRLCALLAEILPPAGGMQVTASGDRPHVIGLNFSPAGQGAVQPSLFVPLFDVTHPESGVIVGRSGYPLEVRIAASAGGAPLVDTPAVRIGAISLAESFSFEVPPGLPDIVLTDVAWQPFGANNRAPRVALIELAANACRSPGPSLVSLVDLIVAALRSDTSDAASASAALKNLARLLAVGQFGIFDGTSFFTQLAADAELLKAWLGALQALIDGAAIPTPIAGSGTDADPFLLPLTGIGVTGQVCLTVVRAGNDELRVGIRVESDVYALAGSIGVQLRGTVDTEGATFAITLCRAGTSSHVSRPLVQYLPLHWIEGAPAHRLSIGSIHCGVRVRPHEADAAKRLQPTLTVEGVERPDDDAACAYDYDLLSLTRRPAAGGSAEAASESAVRLLTDLAGALAAMYQAGEPAPGAAPGDFVGPAVNRAAYQTLIHASKSLTGATSDDVNGLADSITALASWLTAGDLERRACAWLQASVQHGQIFPAVGQLLGSFDEEFSGEDGRLVFRPTSALDVSLGRDANGAFELRVQPRLATESIDYVLGAAVTLDVSGAAAPRVQLTASGGLTEAARRTLAGAGIDVQPQLDLGLALDASLSVTATAAFYPIGDRTFAAELLPTPRLTYESHTLDAPSWLLRLAPRVLLPLVENSVLNRADVKAALEYPLLDFSLAKLLSRLALLRQRDGRYALGEWSAFADLSASAVLTALIDSVQADETQAQADGVHFIALKNGAATDYGIRIRLKDVPLGGKDSGRTLQAGSWLSGETDASNWLVESGGPAGAAPGAELLLCRRTNGSISFDAARIALTSVGLDLEGKAFAGGRKPLVEFGGYALRGLKSRVFLTIDASGAQFGGAIELHEVSMPLGPQAGGEAGSSNPVAANLLASESAADGAAQEAVNPAFSALVAHRDRFYGKVFVANGTPSADGKVWIPIQRTFGPLRCRQIGVGITDEPRLEIGYDGGVSLSALAIDLQDLTISIPLRDPGNVGAYGLDLDGLNFSLAADAVQVSGGLSRIVDEDGRPRYDGMALIKAQDFTITGFGSYAMANDAPSLFIFAVLHKDLGGPAFFHVTGIAAGFGFNRALRLPPVEDVQSFPLVRAALDEHYLQRTPDALSTALTLLRDYIPPSRGNYWLAIGVRFSSFEMVQSFALLSVSFGDETEIGLLGLSTLSVPKGAAAGEAVAYAELALRAVIKPSMGLIAVEGRLTDKSYIFARDCRLTGGFAFYSWFDGPNAGDFVITIGGYHPRFLVPSHYPTVPRLGINWRVSSELSVTGEMYYALTPSCLMAGGRLCAVFHAGPIDAWFTAYANFLLNWQPFHYAIEMGIAIGVACSLRIDLGLFSFTLSLRVELSVDLRLWGPAFAGEVYVNLSVISFTIRFGPSQSAPQPLDAGAFVQACLPPATTTSGLRATTATLAEALGAADVLSLRIANGLLREQQVDGNGLPHIIRVVNAHELALTAQSLVPSTSFEGVITVGKSDDSPFGIRPMGSTSLDSKMQVTLRTEAGDTITGGLVVTTLTSGVPDALWGKSSATGRVDLPSTPEATTLKATVGVRISCAPAATEHPLPPIALAKLKYDDLDPKPFDWLRVAEPDSIEAPGDRTLRNTIWGNAGVDARRRAILGVIARVSPFELYAPQLERLSTSPDYFQAEPELAAVERYETPHGSVVA